MRLDAHALSSGDWTKRCCLPLQDHVGNDCAIYDDLDLDEELDKEIAAANADENDEAER